MFLYLLFKKKIQNFNILNREKKKIQDVLPVIAPETFHVDKQGEGVVRLAS